jgi:hypothetical protein
MPYNLTGPVVLGTAATATTIAGDVTFPAAGSTIDFNATGSNTISNFVLSTDGDLLTQAAGVLARLAVGTDGQILQVVSGAPAWVDSPDYTPEGCNGSLTANQSISTSSEATLAGWTVNGVGQFNTGSFNATTGIWTQVAAGYTEYAASAEWATGNNVGSRILRAYHTDTAGSPVTTLIRRHTIQPSADTSIATCNVVVGRVNMAVGEKLEFRVFQDSGSSINVSSGVGTVVTIQRVTKA